MGMPLQWHRRQAITLASQLPENQSDALLVIAALKELVETFLDDKGDQPERLAVNVIPFGK